MPTLGDWDEVCMICAICPSGGPYELVDEEDLEDVAGDIAAEVKALLFEGKGRPAAYADSPNDGLPEVLLDQKESSSIPDEELREIVTEALASSFSGADIRRGLPEELPGWLPEGLGAIGPWHMRLTRDCVAIGYFGERSGEAPIRNDGRFPDGQHVETRHVRKYSCGNFYATVRQGTKGALLEENKISVCSIYGIHNYQHHPNFWLCKECYECLYSWMDQENLSDKPFSDRELYEVVHSQFARRSDNFRGLIPGVNYGGIHATIGMHQNHFAPGRRESRSIARGIQAGRRGPDLIPHIMEDFQCWMFMRRDKWPEPTQATSTFSTFEPKNSTEDPLPLIATLPSDVFISITDYLSLQWLLILSTTCQRLRAVITDGSFLRRFVRQSVHFGEYNYVLPATPAELVIANEVAKRWLGESGVEHAGLDPFVHPEFPYPAFISACIRSDSMKNRRRIRGIIEQFKELWRKYRSAGWKVDRFYPPNELAEEFKGQTSSGGI
ncbi:hypothetical protein EIP91_000050 [Steccherinum ochraceum]|uniref:F-box domain-containing protein n=1 Tax=Steccherinum ochraceum TaxID=92696 RepID=A0A4R0S2Q4_9APHY|nr:hypothetical protein EIP91_000050 [Steccherinum ochraceum]